MPKPLAANPFIVIESIDAAGGSTQADLLIKKLKKSGFTPHQYHFPQEDRGTGQLIYQKFLHHKGKYSLSRREQALLYIQDFYSRLEEMRSLVEQGSKKSILVTDRYCTSTMAYQTINLTGTERQDMLNWLTWLVWRGEPQLLKPNLVILLDNPVELSIKRLSNSKKDYFENQQKLLAIRRSYLRLAQEQRWTIIDNVDIATNKPRTRQDIHREVWEHVSKVLE